MSRCTVLPDCRLLSPRSSVCHYLMLHRLSPGDFSFLVCVSESEIMAVFCILSKMELVPFMGRYQSPFYYFPCDPSTQHVKIHSREKGIKTTPSQDPTEVLISRILAMPRVAGRITVYFVHLSHSLA